MAEAPERSNFILTPLLMMKQFHLDGKYWDVQLRVGTKVFKSQRSLLAAHSVYFDTMFSKNSEESNLTPDQPIPLHDFDAIAFEELYSFMYTADICVTESNVYQLLFMNDFLQLRTGQVKERCLEHVKSRSKTNEPMSIALDLLRFAHSKGEKVFVDILNAHICRHLCHYSKDARLMEISFENLSALLEFSKDYIVPLRGSADVLLKIIHNWINHNRAGRYQYSSNLMENVDFANVSANFSRSLMNRLEKAVEVVNRSEDIDSLSELKTLVKQIDTNLTDGVEQFDAFILHKFKDVRNIQLGMKNTSSSYIISELVWRIGITFKHDFLFIYLNCGSTNLSSEWNCYARAIFNLVCHEVGKEDFVTKIDRKLFSSNMKSSGWGAPICLTSDDLINPEKGYIDDDGFISVKVHVCVDVPFRKMM